MSGVKCGTPGYKGPKCAVKEYPKCDALEGYTLKQLVAKRGSLTALKAGETKSRHGVNFYLINKKVDERFWFVNSSADGICRQTNKYHPNGAKAWFLYEDNSSSSQVMVSSKQPLPEKDFLDELIEKYELKKYGREYERRYKSANGVFGVLDEFKKEASAALVTVLGAVGLMWARSKIKKARANSKRLESLREREHPLELTRRVSEQRGPERTSSDAMPPPMVRVEKAAPPSEPMPQPMSPPVEKATAPAPAPAAMPPPMEAPKPARTLTPPPMPTDPVAEAARESQSGSGFAGIPADEDGNPVIKQTKPLAKDADPTLPDKLPGQWEPDETVVDTLLEFDVSEEFGLEKSPLRALEAEYGIKIPRDIVKSAALIVRYKYKPKGRLFSEVLVEVVSKAAEKASERQVIFPVEKSNGKMVTQVDLKDAVIELISPAETAEFSRGEMPSVKSLGADIDQIIEDHSKWLSRRTYYTKEYLDKHPEHKPSNGEGGKKGAYIGDSEPLIDMKAMEAKAAKERAAKFSGVDAPTVDPTEVPSEVLREVERRNSSWSSFGESLVEGTEGEKSRSLEFSGFPRITVPPFRSAEYFRRAGDALARFVKNDLTLKRTWLRSETAMEKITSAFRTVLSGVNEETAKKYYDPETDEATRAGFEAAAKKETAITHGWAERVTNIVDEATLPGGIHPDKVRAEARAAIEADAELRLLQSFEKSDLIERCVLAFKEPGYAEMYFVDGKLSAEAVYVARDIIRPSCVTNGRSVQADATRSSKIKAKPKADAADPFADWDRMFEEDKNKGAEKGKKK